MEGVGPRVTNETASGARLLIHPPKSNRPLPPFESRPRHSELAATQRYFCSRGRGRPTQKRPTRPSIRLHLTKRFDRFLLAIPICNLGSELLR